jgi:hypothetical protein
MESRARLQARGRRGTRRMHYSFEHHTASRLSEPQYCRQSARVVLHLHKGRIQLSPRPSSRLLVFRPPFIEADTKSSVILGPAYSVAIRLPLHRVSTTSGFARAGVQAIRRPATELSCELVQSDQAAESGGLRPSRVLQRIPGGEIRRLGNVVSGPHTGGCETKKCAVDLHPVVGAAGTVAVRTPVLGFLPARAVRNVWRIFENVAASHDWPSRSK